MKKQFYKAALPLIASALVSSVAIANSDERPDPEPIIVTDQMCGKVLSPGHYILEESVFCPTNCDITGNAPVVGLTLKNDVHNSWDKIRILQVYNVQERVLSHTFDRS